MAKPREMFPFFGSEIPEKLMLRLKHPEFTSHERIALLLDRVRWSERAHDASCFGGGASVHVRLKSLKKRYQYQSRKCGAPMS